MADGPVTPSLDDVRARAVRLRDLAWSGASPQVRLAAWADLEQLLRDHPEPGVAHRLLPDGRDASVPLAQLHRAELLNSPLGRPEEAEALMRVALAGFERDGEREGQLVAVYDLTAFMIGRGEYDDAEQLLDSVSTNPAPVDPYCAGLVAARRADLCAARSRPGAARKYRERAIACFRRGGEHRLLLRQLIALAFDHLQAGTLLPAEQLLDEALAMRHELMNDEVAELLYWCSRLAARRGDEQRRRELLEQAMRLGPVGEVAEQVRADLDRLPTRDPDPALRAVGASQSLASFLAPLRQRATETRAKSAAMPGRSELAPRVYAGSVPAGAVVLADIDHLKVLNHLLGHDAGDAAILAVQQAFHDLAPAGALAGRWSGGAMLLLLEPDASGAAEPFARRMSTWLRAEPLFRAQPPVALTAEEVRESHPFLDLAPVAEDTPTVCHAWLRHPGTALRARAACPEGPALVAGLFVTMSFGVAVAQPGGDAVESLLRRADEALFEGRARRRERQVGR